jgi:hypothetical protein
LFAVDVVVSFVVFFPSYFTKLRTSIDKLQQVVLLSGSLDLTKKYAEENSSSTLY